MFLYKPSFFLTLYFFIGTTLLFSQESKLFPELTGETLEDSVISLPVDTKGKYTLVGLAYSKKADKSLETWLQPAYDLFIAPKYSNSPFTAFAYDVNLYFIPMFTGLNKAATKTAKKNALKNVHPRLHSYMLFYKGSLSDYKDELELKDKKEPYFFVLDKEGNILHSTSGVYSQQKMEKIEEFLED